MSYDIDDLSEWQLQADTFSDYIFSGIWDYGVALASKWMLLIWSGGGQADWFLAAEDESLLAEAARKIWILDEVGKAFWSNTDEGEAALARIAAGMVRR